MPFHLAISHWLPRNGSNVRLRCQKPASLPLDYKALSRQVRCECWLSARVPAPAPSHAPFAFLTAGCQTGGLSEIRTRDCGVKSTLLWPTELIALESSVGLKPTVDGLKIRGYVRLASSSYWWRWRILRSRPPHCKCGALLLSYIPIIGSSDSNCPSFGGLMRAVRFYTSPLRYLCGC